MLRSRTFRSASTSSIKTRATPGGRRSAGTYTASDGTYDVGGLATGTYRVGFRDYSGATAFEYFDNATSVELRPTFL